MGGAIGNIVSGVGDAIGGAVQGVSDLVHDVGESPIVQTALPIVASAVGGPLAGAATSAALSLDAGKSPEQALTNAAVNYAASSLANSLGGASGGDGLTSMEAGVDWGTPDFASMNPSDLASIEAGIDWGTPDLSAIDKSSLANAFSTGGNAVADWVVKNPLSAASLGLAAAKAFTPTNLNGVTYTPVNWNYLAPQLNPNQSALIPSTYAMPQTQQQTYQRDIQLSQNQLMDPTVLAAQRILNKPGQYRAPAYQPLVSPSNLQANPATVAGSGSGKGGLSGLQSQAQSAANSVSNIASGIESGLANLFKMF